MEDQNTIERVLRQRGTYKMKSVETEQTNKTEIDTRYWFFIRKDIMACTFLSIEAKLILSSLLARQKNVEIRSNADMTHSLYAFTYNETKSAFEELESLGFFDKYEREGKTFICTLNGELINHHFNKAVY